MELTIHLYGYAYHMFNTLSAIAMLRNSTLYPAIINTVTIVVAAYYALKISGSNADGEWRQYLKKILGIVVLINGLLLPKTSVNIKDHVEKHFWRVDNIPLAFALPIGVVEEMGHLLTIGFEQAFSAIDGRSAFNYYHHGNVFGARLAKEVMQSKVRDPEFVANMNKFIERCVILPAMIGHQFTKEELVATKDMWGLVSKNAGTFTRVPMIIRGVRQDPSPTCKQAVPYFEDKMRLVAAGDITAMSIKLRAPGAKAKYNPSHIKLNEALSGQIQALYDSSEIAVEDIIKHNMMINSLNQYRAGKYPNVKAQLQHEAGGLISGDLADRILTGLLTVMKNMIYGSFIFVLPLMIFAGGMAKYRGWVTTCISLQLWPPLFAMLNMIIDTAYDPAHIVSYSGWSTAMHKMDHIASLAAGLNLMIPFLAVYVTRMGEGGLLHLAGGIMSSMQGAAGAAAAEKASGGMSYDNINTKNINRDNVGENKFNNAQQYVTGTNSGINADGSMETILPNGQVITAGGAGTTSSVGEAKYQETDSISSAFNSIERQELQAIQSEGATLSKVEESLVSREVSALKNLSEAIKQDKGISIDTTTEDGKEVSKAINQIDEMTKTNGHSWEQNARAYIKGEAGLSGSFAKFFGGLVGVNFSAGVGGEVNAINASSQQDAHSSKVDESNNTSQKQGINTRSNNTESALESIGVDKSQQEGFRNSYNEMQRLEASTNAHKDNLKTVSEGRELTRNSANEYSKDQTQDVIDAYARKYGVSDAEAGRKVLSGSPEARALHSSMGMGKAQGMMAHIKASRDHIENSDIIEKVQERGQAELVQHKEGADAKVSGYAKAQGMGNAAQVEQSINEQKGTLQKTHNNKMTLTDDNYGAAKHSNELEKQGREGQIQKYEEDRIGRGRVGTLWGMADGVGRPKEEVIPTFKPIMRDVGQDKWISSLDGHPVSKPSSDNDNTGIDLTKTQQMMNLYHEPHTAKSENNHKQANEVVDINKIKNGV
ncbi:MAG: conjugal transfer protein TraG N-terminal domain-containing protein [Proteobacteria bacterium]|nr:conjugal transfer protein TraG N-terminal domain-containing protein [Pseudomonadota bacterium]